MTVVDDIGLLCLTIDAGENHQIIGRTKLQKMVYFCQYLGWDIRDYKLHYYGPFSFGLADIVNTAENLKLIHQGDASPYMFDITDDGNEFLDKFVTKVCDVAKVNKTRNLIQFLSSWTKEELELAATIDFVSKNNPGITRTKLIDKVGNIKENFSSVDITDAHSKWLDLKKYLRTNV